MSKNLLILFFLLIAIFTSCKKDDTATTTEVPTEQDLMNIDSPWQYSITIDGTPFSAIEGQHNFNGIYSNGGSVFPPPDTTSMSYGSILINDTSNINDLSISKGYLNFTTGQIPDSILFAVFFAPGSYSYFNNAGMTIDWYDSNGDLWSTKFGMNNQSGSYFVINDVKFDYVDGYLMAKIYASFKCKLFNLNGLFKTLTNGHCVAQFLAS
jgi:hypothetical protein